MGCNKNREAIAHWNKNNASHICSSASKQTQHQFLQYAAINDRALNRNEKEEGTEQFVEAGR